MFTSDRDLLVLEPGLFRDASWVGQQLARGEARINSGIALFTAGGINRDAALPGMVLVIGRIPLEIMHVIDDTQVEVSLLRADIADPVIVPTDMTAAPALCTTFRPQIALMHHQILAMLGLARAGEETFGNFSEDAVTNPGELTLLESLGALNLIFSGLAAASGPDSVAWQKADMYAKRFARERFRAHAKLDTNNDGQPDALRRCNIMHLVRA